MRGLFGIRNPSRLLGGRGRTIVTGAAGLVVVAAAAVAPLSSASAEPRPALSFTPANYNISLLPGEFLDRDFTLSNGGSTPAGALKLRLTAVESSVPGGTGFSITSEDCPASLRPGKSCTITVRFAPSKPLGADVALTASSPRATATLPLSGTARDETLPNQCQSDYYCIIGTEGNDFLSGSGTLQRDWIEGYGGDDELHGKVGADMLIGGTGNDLLYGGTGGDFLNGGDVYHPSGADGDDTLHGKEQDDYLAGQRGSDHVYGDDGDDELHANLGYDDPDGSPDYMDGGAGNDTCYASEPIDVTVNCEVIW